MCLHPMRSSVWQFLGVALIFPVVLAGSRAASDQTRLFAWGYNEYGTVGNGDPYAGTNFPSLVKAPYGSTTFTNVVKASGSGGLSVAVRADGTVWSWGDNQHGGGLGHDVAQCNFPVQVLGPGGVGFFMDAADVAVSTSASSAARFALIRKTDGTVWGWGLNSVGQLGDGTTANRSMPVQALGPGGMGFLTDVVAVSPGANKTFALKNDGTIWGWGEGSSSGLGNGDATDSRTPVQVVGPGGTGFLSGVIAISANGSSHTLALKSDGTVFAWGGGSEGRLGDGATTTRLTPVQVLGLSGLGPLTDVASVVAAGGHTLVVMNDGALYATGDNTFGQLGDDTRYTHVVLEKVVAPGGVGPFFEAKSIAAATQHSVALKNDGTVWAWGRNNFGQLGIGTTQNRPLPTQVKGPGGVGVLSEIIAMAAGGDYTIAQKSDGTVWAWGNNNHGQLGDGTNTHRLTPVQVLGENGEGFLTHIVALVAGASHTLALRRDGTVWAWGTNSNFVLGDGGTESRNTPVRVKGVGGVGHLAGIIALSAGSSHSLALGMNGEVYAWGENGGKLGDDTMDTRSTPVSVLGPGGIGRLSGIVSLAAGSRHSVALKSDGTVWTWGYGEGGELGNNTGQGSLTPVQVAGVNGVGFLTDIVAVSAGAGGRSTLALKSDGTVWIWGLGYGIAPTQVRGPGGVGFLEDIAVIAAGGAHFIALNAEGVVQGNVDLEAAFCADEPIRFEFRPQGGGAPVVRIINSGPQGVFSFTDLPEGVYDVAIKGSKWLQRTIPNINTTGGNNILNLRVFLIAGDANDDNSIDVLDLDTLIQAFDSTPFETWWNAGADFNCDDSVDVLDLDVLLRNFDIAGDS